MALRLTLTIAVVAALLGVTSPAGAAEVPEPGDIEVVSVNSDGEPGDSGVVGVDVAADGRTITFASHAENMIGDDTNNSSDVFVHNRDTEVTERVSIATGGTEADGDSEAPSISADGRYVAFQSDATNLGGPGDRTQVYVHDRLTNITTWVSVLPAGADPLDSAGGFDPRISADGTFVVYTTTGLNETFGALEGSSLVVGVEVATLQVELVSASQVGGPPINFGDGSAATTGLPDVNADGRFVVFTSDADNLVDGDDNGGPDVFVRDRVTDTTVLASVKTGGAQSLEPSGEHGARISDDGSRVVFDSLGPLVDGDSNGASDVFLRDLSTGETTLISEDRRGRSPREGGSWPADISGDGSTVAFWSNGSDLLPAEEIPRIPELYFRDLTVDRIQRAVVAPDGSKTEGHEGGIWPALDGNGTTVAFISDSDDIVTGVGQSRLPHAFVSDVRSSGQCEDQNIKHPDVDPSSYAADAINCIRQLSVTTRTHYEEYEPNGRVSREQMAAFLGRLWRALGMTCPSGDTPFTDIDSDSYAYDDIGCIYALGITTGTTPTTYDLTGSVTREQIAAFLARLWRALGGTCPTDPTPFTDIDPSSYAYDDIGCIYALGITTGTTPTTYDLTGSVTREQMAAFLARLFRAATLTRHGPVPTP